MTARKTNRWARPGFTLLEVLVVVAIIVVLAGIGGYYLLPKVDEAKESTALNHVKTFLTNACEEYKLKNDVWPDSLQALSVQQPNGMAPLITQDALLDPWDKPYQYDAHGGNNQGRVPDIWTIGPRGNQIGNWMKKITK
jgi:general secretion pathway protein G